MDEPKEVLPKVDRFSNRAIAALNKEYVVIGKRRVHYFYSWLVMGLLAGTAIGVALVANRSGQFDESAATGPTAVNLTPVTTLAAETGNNTSAGATFAGCETSTVTNGQCANNGNLKASNVSKVNLHTLLPTHPATKIYLNYVPYWGQSNHPNIGYSSNDVTQAAAEIANITSQGFDGLVVDWYGQGSWEDASTKLIKADIDKQAKLTFSLMIDQGSIKWHSCYPTCSATQALLNTISYARTTGYFSDPHYQLLNAKPIVHEFALSMYPIDWPTIMKANPDLQFLWESQGSYTNPNSIGAYAWPQPKNYNAEPAGYEGLDYLSNFYATALKYPTKYTVGAVWKGFDDTVASWSTFPFNVAGVNGGRRIEQNCAQTWLDTWNAANTYTGRLDAVQVTTWSDYEEGTEAETGIANCASVSGSMAGHLLNWTLAGKENTIDHFTVYISKDGQNLSVLQDQVPASFRSIDLSQYAIPAGTYSLFIKAVGKPSIVNTMSNKIAYSVATAPPPPPPVPPPPTSCTKPTFIGGSVTPATVLKGGGYKITCNYGFVGPGIAVQAGSGKCIYANFTGTSAVFNCAAGTTAGTFKNACVIDAGNTKNLCVGSNPINSLIVQ